MKIKLTLKRFGWLLAIMAVLGALLAIFLPNPLRF